MLLCKNVDFCIFIRRGWLEMFVLCFLVDFWKTYLKLFHLLWGKESHRAYAEGSLELEWWTFDDNGSAFFMKTPSIFYWSNVFQTTGVLYLVTLQSLVSDFSPFYLTLSSFFSTTFSIGKKILNAKISYFKHIIINLFLL